MDDLREACARVARWARYVAIDEPAIAPYAAALRLDETPEDGLDAVPAGAAGDPEALAAYWLTLDAINFGSGWFPTLRKRDGMSGYRTVATAWRRQPAPGAGELAQMDAPAVARILGQDPDHELNEPVRRVAA